MMKALALILVSMMLMGALAPSSIYFQDDFSNVDGWTIAQGDGTVFVGGTFRGEEAWFLKDMPQIDIEDLYYEIIVSDINGTWGVSFLTLEDTRAVLYEEMFEIGVFSGKMLNTVVIDGIIIEVDGEVTFNSIIIFSNLNYGNPLGDWAEGIDEFMDANPWVAPAGLSIIILVVGVLLIFGKKRR